MELKVRQIEESLKNSENPVNLVIINNLEISYYDDYNSFLFPVCYDVFMGKKAIIVNLSFSDAKANPDQYIKPLDIVKTFIPRPDKQYAPYMVHACIYLGNRQICHAGSLNNTPNNIVIESWDKFLSVLSSANKMLRYHPVIPFKKSEKIIEHIAKCVENKEKYFSIKGDFSLFGDQEREANNCECLVNRCVLGLNFSELVHRRMGNSSLKVNTKEKLIETNYDLDNELTNCSSYKIREITGYTNVYHPQGIKMEARIEVQPKSTIFKDIISQYMDRYIYETVKY